MNTTRSSFSPKPNHAQQSCSSLQHRFAVSNRQRRSNIFWPFSSRYFETRQAKNVLVRLKRDKQESRKI